MSNMLRKSATKGLVCMCRKHHRPPRAWSKAARHQARAREKQKWTKEAGND